MPLSVMFDLGRALCTMQLSQSQAKTENLPVHRAVIVMSPSPSDNETYCITQCRRFSSKMMSIIDHSKGLRTLIPKKWMFVRCNARQKSGPLLQLWRFLDMQFISWKFLWVLRWNKDYFKIPFWKNIFFRRVAFLFARLTSSSFEAIVAWKISFEDSCRVL